MEIAIAVNLKSACMKVMQAGGFGLWPRKAKFETKHNDKQSFDVQTFLNSAGVDRKIVELKSKETVFRQGDPATSVLYIQKGIVKLSVLNEAGNEAVVAILGSGNFFGESCLGGRLQRVSTASTITPSTILKIEKPQMIRLLHAENALQDRFVRHLVLRTIRMEDNLVSHLVNSVEKRLARTLLLLARSGNLDRSEGRFPEISQEMLAEMIGTTRSRINCFMNKFRKLGFIEYGISLRGLKINESLQTVLHDTASTSEQFVGYRTSRFARTDNYTPNSEFSQELHGATKH
ncbi:MAG TPA: Crp/Fnr family transcriptional regulator [Candidatus Acidoferrum sp.]|nr:Crp/Fnr family transcriptional regulator [Candidatus Acidoferrum sp.]